MLLPAFLDGRRWTARCGRQRVSSWRTLFPFLLVPLLLSAEPNPANSTFHGNGGFGGGILLGLVLAMLVGGFARTRFKTAERASATWKELADHREYERNLAQQELVGRLEEERELATLGLEEILDRDAVVLIEWGERFPRLLPARRTEIHLRTVAEDEREIEVRFVTPDGGIR